jgi:hypothetical protein
MSVLVFDESGEADGLGFAAWEGVINAAPRRSAAKEVKRKSLEADAELF